MAKERHLPRAPIIEAVVDFRVRTPINLDVNVFREMAVLKELGYSKHEALTELEFGFHRQPGKPPESTQVDRGIIGYRYTSGDGKFVAQIRRNGATISRLEPYTEWATLFHHAAAIYTAYASVAEIEEVSRIAVRYINRMPLPIDQVGDFSPFLTAPPKFPDEVPVTLSHFLTKLQVQDAESGIQASVIQTIHQAVKLADKVVVVLDIDAFQQGPIPIEPGATLQKFAALRNFKNRVFFASITEEAAKLFE